MHCSEDFEFEARALQTRLIDRGYSRSCLKKAYRRAKLKDRENVIHSQKPCKRKQKVRLITRYAEEHKKVIQKYWQLLATDEVLSKYVESYPQITYRKYRSLKYQLVHGHLIPRGVEQTCRGTALVEDVSFVDF